MKFLTIKHLQTDKEGLTEELKGLVERYNAIGRQVIITEGMLSYIEHNIQKFEFEVKKDVGS